MATETLTGAQALIRSLELLGVDTVFGLARWSNFATYDPLMDSKKLRHILVRHEQGCRSRWPKAMPRQVEELEFVLLQAVRVLQTW